MKTNVLLFAALLLVAANVSVAKEGPVNAGLAVVPVKGSETFKVIYKGEVASRAKLVVYNSSSQIIFSETISGDGFIRPLNFEGMRAGEYSFEVTDASGKKTEKVVYTPAKMLAASKKVVHVSKVSNDNRFLVSVKDAGAEKMTVSIYDVFNNLLFSETREVSGEFAQIYWVKNHDNVRIEVTDSFGNSKVSRF